VNDIPFRVVQTLYLVMIFTPVTEPNIYLPASCPAQHELHSGCYQQV
jgi:hypothetical protein